MVWFGVAFRAATQMAETAKAPAGPGDPADVEAARNARYHRRIVLVAGCCAALGVALGLLGAVYLVPHVRPVSEVGALKWVGGVLKCVVLPPAMGGVAGFALGTALMCLVAPRAFLVAPAGQRWLRLIGTRSVRVARVVCCLLCLGVPLVMGGFALLLFLR
jgi:hypothetical protein